MNTLPLRRMTLHLAQRFRTDGDTFMNEILLTHSSTCSQGLDYTRSLINRPVSVVACFGSSPDSQEQRFSFGDSHTMFKMGCQ